MSVKHTTDSFKNAVKEVNPHNLDLSKVNYVNSLSKVTVICGDCNNEFEVVPQQLTNKRNPSGCPKCGRERTNLSVRSRIVTPEVLEGRFRKVHSDTYNYDWDSYTSLHENMIIICKHHGPFSQLPCNHESGANCPVCGAASRSVSRSIPYLENVARSRKAHGDKYEYPEEGYTHGKLPMKIVCPTHGVFEQWPYDHWDGHGCNACSKALSAAELELGQFIESLGVSIERDVTMPSRRRLDIVCKDLGLAFEYNGLFWHAEEQGRYPNYHLEKTQEAESIGLRLVHIFEDEWVFNKDKTKRWVSTILGTTSEKSNARDTSVGICSWAEASSFLEENHMQGSGAYSNLCYALKKDQQICSVMVFSFSNVEEGYAELTRFSSVGRVRGGFSKLLKKFTLDHPEVEKVISFSDKRWSLGGVYEANNFTKIGSTPPNYWYAKSLRRFHRRGFQHKYLQDKLANYNPSISEYENCKANGYSRVWDCGLDKWELTVK